MSRLDFKIVPARAAHVRYIARNMREADRAEVWAASRKTPGDALIFSLRKSSMAWTAIVNGKPEVMWGVGDLNILAGVGAPWLLGTDAVEKHYRLFLRQSVNWRNQLLQRYSILRNFVDDRNVVAIRWLEWMGFKILEPIEINGHAFRLFELRAENVRS